MDARSRAPRTSGRRPDGQHFLRSSAIAAELVRDACIGPTDHVLEIGAGTGRLTEPLALAAASITAVELDPRLVEGLRRRFADDATVRVLHGDIRAVDLPDAPWRAFGNVPFSVTTPILRRLLDDLGCGPVRADLLIQFEAARKRASVERGSLLSIGWFPWWQMTLTRRLPRSSFDPPPSVDAGVLTVVRRPRPLLPPQDRAAYADLVRLAFDRGSWPVQRSLGRVVPPKAWKRLARSRGVPVAARPAHLDGWDWVAVFELARSQQTRVEPSSR